MKKVYRFFGGFLESQQRWLNRMADRGWRLTGVTRLSFTFEPCQAGEYRYAVEFVGEKSNADRLAYRQFLEEFGYRCFDKSINLNYSVGKVRVRPWAKGAGKVATSPGAFNREILIVEKRADGEPFALHTTNADRAAYYRRLRNMHMTCALAFAAAAAFTGWYVRIDESPVWGVYVFAALAVLFGIPVLPYAAKTYRYSRESVEE
ncbi:DUF2812 domain-containing protein [Feifania hominis]|uniref:DUF2812 domain-containing protein n=1 Tax=Feifania hominis TaxID=2763660 RepID=A0A926DCN8_9FIRM|nr:DUF2812 domain-containing protein [Feifania hominis]MBC8535391.1 DUF2812 domain-containing protein [Feifania hominis]